MLGNNMIVENSRGQAIVIVGPNTRIEKTATMDMKNVSSHFYHISINGEMFMSFNFNKVARDREFILLLRALRRGDRYFKMSEEGEYREGIEEDLANFNKVFKAEQTFFNRISVFVSNMFVKEIDTSSEFTLEARYNPLDTRKVATNYVVWAGKHFIAMYPTILGAASAIHELIQSIEDGKIKATLPKGL